MNPSSAFLSFSCLFLFSMCDTYLFFFFFFNDTATTEIYTLSLHDALPICSIKKGPFVDQHLTDKIVKAKETKSKAPIKTRSEEHTSELQSPCNLVCRLLLEKKKKQNTQQASHKNHALTHNNTQTTPPHDEL